MKKALKNRKGGLSTILAGVFMLILTTLVFVSAVHPSAGVIKENGQQAGIGILNESQAMTTDFVPVPMIAQ